jgi:hypothetical protein
VPTRPSRGTSASEHRGTHPRTGYLAYGDLTGSGRQCLVGRLSVRADLPPLPVRQEESVRDEEVDLFRVHGLGWRCEPPSSGAGIRRQVYVDAAEECDPDG